MAVDAVILATPLRVSAGIGASLGPVAGAREAERLGTSPIVNVHLVLDRKVTDLPMAACVDSPVQFVFDRTVASGAKSGQCLVISLSAADSYMATGSPELVSMFFEALRELFPAARQARLVDAIVTREKAATFRARSRHQGVPPPDRDRGARLVPRRRLVRHRVAGDDGGCGPQRPTGGLAGAGPLVRLPAQGDPRQLEGAGT